jgi:CMP-2-keto-3-deoxyoctulosonic acid synthetase
MYTIALIPARYNSSRFPGKLMQILEDKTVILSTYQAAVNTGLFRQVVVVTDSSEIFREIVSHGGAARMSLKEHSCGSDRIAEAAVFYPEAELIVNVQGTNLLFRPLHLPPLLTLSKARKGKTQTLPHLCAPYGIRT